MQVKSFVYTSAFQFFILHSLICPHTFSSPSLGRVGEGLSPPLGEVGRGLLFHLFTLNSLYNRLQFARTMFHRNKLSACTLPWRTKNTIHKRAHGGDVVFHRIPLSHKGLHACEGVKHDFEKYFWKITCIILLCFLTCIIPKTAFYITKHGLLTCNRPCFTSQKVIF